MRYLLAIMVSLVTVVSASADEFQLIPLLNERNGSSTTEQLHATLVVNVSKGDIYYCAAVMQGTSPAKLNSVGCGKGTVKAGSIPPGPAALSPYGGQSGAYAGIWKVEPSTSTVTFCGAEEASYGIPRDWHCGAAKLP